MRDFLKRFIVVEEGKVTDKKGHLIGVHEGAALYTVGQRHGFNITKPQLAKTQHYVVAVDTKNNVVFGMHWISGRAPSFLTGLYAQTRYREKPVAVKIRSENGQVCVDFSHPHVVSPGQSIVIYDGEKCLGGGPIGNSISQGVHSASEE